LDARATAALRYVLFAGEVFPIRHLRTLHGLLPVSCALYNLYGPTETNVCLFHRVRERDLARDRPVYIGTPIPGQTAEVVDGDGNPVDATTELGELVISGSCVTPGYWGTGDGRNDANHRRGRHATGDLVRREDGLFVYHGRKDRMIKLNGNRVELGEIEAALLSVPAIVEVAVVVDTCESAQNIVAFYATGDGAAKLGLLEIKKHCSGLLPRYMIPRFAHHLDELPKNRNGKIDFGALAQRLARKEPLRAEREGAAPDSVAGPAW
jgi:acyl-coenzyme A synthetase/AMP-(fatty) acid ligase